MFRIAHFIVVFALCGGCLSDVWKDPPLILTPYINAGRIEEARAKSLVTKLKPNITSYSGFFNVDDDCDSNLFFWFFPSRSNYRRDPVSIWLNGGPGSSSMYGLLTENGPYDLTPDYKLVLRKYPWNANSSVIYFDNPVGTGYSFTKGPFRCYPQDETQVGQSMLRALEQFFKLFPELKSNPFYLTGESYAGKYIPAIAHAIDTSKTTLRLDGLAIGNPWTDPINQVNNSDFFYQLGLLDENGRQELDIMEERVRRLIREKKYLEAMYEENNSIYRFFALSGYKNIYNFLYWRSQPQANELVFLNRTEMREALHVGKATMNNGAWSYEGLKYDFMQSITPWLEKLMEKYRVLLYFGQTDLRVGYPPGLNFIKKMKWSGAADYRKAKRKFFMVDHELAGYVKTVGKFTEMMIRNAGHMVPTDQPKWALEMYNRFIFNQPMA